MGEPFNRSRGTQDYDAACATTLEFAYMLGIVTLTVSFVAGCFFHFCWIFTVWGVLYFIAIRWRWYEAYLTEKRR